MAGISSFKSDLSKPNEPMGAMESSCTMLIEHWLMEV